VVPLLAALMAVGCGTVGCVTDNTPESSASVAPGASAPPPLDLAGDAPWPTPYDVDPVWRRAAAGNDMDLARLARRENADALLAAVPQGGSLGRTALAALPYAADRHAARGPLCAYLARAQGPSLSLLLAGLFDAVVEAPRSVESHDPAADAQCTDALTALGDELASPGDRDRVVSLLDRLQRRELLQ
jgi:hypothetical protein